MSSQKVALVTGGNRGLGHETCRQLASRGFQVLLASRDPASGMRAVNDIGLDNIEAVKLDVCSPDDIRNVAEYVADQYGYLDVLINNAGVLMDAKLGDPASIKDADIDIVMETFRINTAAPIALINALLPLMEQVQDARIINISSGMGQLSDMGTQYPGYRISKTALNSMTAIYAAELDAEKFSINAVCPGWVRTDMGTENAGLTVEQGVDTTIWLATAEEARVTGGYYRDRKLLPW
ncbi:MAG: SDR family NAD(P)-dependent oxidoreductase [Pseudomonadota bacterium]